MESEYIIFGENLKAIREAAGMTQLELALKVERTQKTISKIEKGRQRIYLGDVYMFAKALQVPAALLLTGQTTLDATEIDDFDKQVMKELHSLSTAESRQTLLDLVQDFCKFARAVQKDRPD